MSKELPHPTISTIAVRLYESPFQPSVYETLERSVHTQYHLNEEGRTCRGDKIAEFISGRQYDAHRRARTIIGHSAGFESDLHELGYAHSPASALHEARRDMPHGPDLTLLYPFRRDRKHLRIYEASFGPMMETLVDKSGFESNVSGHTMMGPIAVFTYDMTATAWMGSREGETLQGNIFHIAHCTHGPWKPFTKHFVLHMATGRVWSQQAAAMLDLESAQMRLSIALARALEASGMLHPYPGGLPQEAS